MPLEFLNVPNNMAGFYVAQGLGLRRTTLPLAHRAFAFESALELAAFNMSAGDQALVGGVEACAYPLDVHRRRLGLAAEAALAECSSWLHVGTAAEGASARCEWVGFFPHRGGLLVHLEETHLPGDVRLAGGRGMDGARLAALARAAGIDEHYDCRATAHGDAHCAHAIASFIAGRRAQALLYVDRDPGDRYAAVCVSLTAPD